MTTTQTQHEGKTMTLAAAHLSAEEWDRRATALQKAVKEWLADLDEIDSEPILREAGLLYGLNEHDADLVVELMQPPMRAPSYHAAAIVLLAEMAALEAYLVWDKSHEGIERRNFVWLRDGQMPHPDAVSTDSPSAAKPYGGAE